MAYNLWNAQMAKGWQERIRKEEAIAQRFWTKYAKQRDRGKLYVPLLEMPKGNPFAER